MKKFLIALLMAAGLLAVAPKAEAGQYARLYTSRGPVYVHKSALYGNGCSNNSYRSHRTYRHYPSYHRTVRSYPVYRSYPRYYSSSSHCAPRRPSFSIAFGF